MRSKTVVIGAGPGGYVAAIRLGQLGQEVTLIEKAKLGGTCLHMGCIPSKALIGVAKHFEEMNSLSRMGLTVEGQVKLDFATTQKWKQGSLDQLARGIAGLCKANKVNVIQGEARFNSAHQLKITTAAGEDSLDFEQCIIATGSVPAAIPTFPFNGKTIVSSTEALAFEAVPKRLVVLGGGYIGLEMASMYAKLGTAVTVVEMLPGLLTGFDPEAVSVVEKKLRRNKVEIHVNTKAVSYKDIPGGVQLTVDRGGETSTIDADAILVTVGRKPFTANLDLEKAGVEKTPQGFIKVNERLQTSVPNIYAIGDVATQPMLAHKASYEAEIAAENIAGHKSIYDSKVVPGVVFTDPELASVGLSADEAKQKGYSVIIGKFPFAALGKALITGHTDGFVKVVADATSHLILGLQIVGSDAGNLISEGVALIEMGSTVDDLGLMIHPHPTMGEALMEAGKAATGQAIHVPNAR